MFLEHPIYLSLDWSEILYAFTVKCEFKHFNFHFKVTLKRKLDYTIHSLVHDNVILSRLTLNQYQTYIPQIYLINEEALFVRSEFTSPGSEETV
jgi:hypothetical protein